VQANLQEVKVGKTTAKKLASVSPAPTYEKAKIGTLQAAVVHNDLEAELNMLVSIEPDDVDLKNR